MASFSMLTLGSHVGAGNCRKQPRQLMPCSCRLRPFEKPAIQGSGPAASKRLLWWSWWACASPGDCGEKGLSALKFCSREIRDQRAAVRRRGEAP